MPELPSAGHNSGLDDPSKCPGCNTAVPEWAGELSTYRCEKCGGWVLDTGALPTPLAWGGHKIIRVHRSPHWHQAADSIRDKSAAGQPGPTPPTIWFHGERSYSIDGVNPFKVSIEFDSILTAFRENTLPLETSELEEQSGVTNVSRAMKDLSEWNGGIFAKAIRVPSGKNKGGYFARVKSL